MKKKLLKYFLCKNLSAAAVSVLLICSYNIVFSQIAPKLNIALKLNIVGGDLKNSLITITKNGTPFRVVDPSKEKSDLDIPLGEEYLFTFTKIGYASKSIIVNTHVPTNRENGHFAKFISDVSLVKQDAGKETDYTPPYGKIVFSLKKDDFDFENIQQKTDVPKTTPLPIIVMQQVPKLAPVKATPVSPEISKTRTGKTKEKKVIQEDSRKITLITIIIDGNEYIYKKEEYGWGGIYCYKNGVNISKNTFDNETE